MFINVKKTDDKEVNIEEKQESPNGFEVTWFWQNQKEDNSSILRKALRHTFPILLASIVLLLVSSTLEMFIIFRLRNIVNQALDGNVSIVLDEMKIVIVFITILFPILVINSRLSSTYIGRSTANIKYKYLKKLASASINDFESENKVKYISNLTENMNVVQRMYLFGRYNMISAFISVIAGIVLAVIVDWVIILIALSIGFIIVIGIVSMSSIVTKIMDSLVSSYDEYTNFTREVLSGLQVIKANDLEPRILDEFVVKSTKIQTERANFQKVQLKVNLYTQIVVSALLLIFMIVANYLVWYGRYSSGDIIYIITTFTVVLLPGVNIFMNLPDIKAGKKALNMIEESIVYSTNLNEEELFTKRYKEIEFRDVSFSYDGNKKILNDVNIKLRRGGKYLIVGESGSGKSTLLKMLRKHTKATSGRILFDGKPLESFSNTSYFDELSFVEQNVFLFEDTLRNNISLYGDYSELELDVALRKSRLSKFVNNSQLGLEYMILDDGKNISGGEKLRIAFARAVLRESSLFILDEPFSNLDDSNAIELEKTLLNLEGITVVNVSHVVFDQNLHMYDAVIKVDDKVVQLFPTNSSDLQL